ncbi:MAG: hypothetical protein ACKVP7_14485 [Hyphomicrobiaceae bacterium]
MRIMLAAALALALLDSAAYGQRCDAPSQVCAPGVNGDGGCFMPNAAKCVAGMICETGLAICPPSSTGDGGCFDPARQVCNAGAIAAQSSSSVAVPPATNAACRDAQGGDRVAILDALRKPVSQALGAPVEFKVTRARICGDWAFVVATPQRPGGRAMRWAGTPCAGDTSHLAGGLMRRSGPSWSLVDHALCPSDVAWADWPERHQAPQFLFDE